MKASTQYSDFIGTAAADESDGVAIHFGRRLEGISKYLKIDESRFKPVGLSIHGTRKKHLSIICVDIERSSSNKEFIVKISVKSDENILSQLFKRLDIVLYNKHDEKYSNLDIDEEASYEDFH